MKNLKPYKHLILEKIISLFFLMVNRQCSNITIERHNGINIFDYPERSWTLIPFPNQKGVAYNSDNLSTVNRYNFMESPEFLAAKNEAEGRWGVPNEVRDISWRLHVMLWAFGVAMKNPLSKNAIFIECGTGRGYMAAAVSKYFKLSEKFPPFYLIDTFSSDLILDFENSKTSPAAFAYSNGDEEVREYFSKYNNVIILKGFIPDILSELPRSPICFLHVDLNNAAAELAALEQLVSQFISGAIIIFDDYGGPGGEEQALCHEQFAKKYNKHLLILPTGQAIIHW